MRKIVTIKKIDEIRPIDGADKIVAAKIGGWTAVVKKEDFNQFDKVLYFEVDTFLPVNVPEFAFLESRGTKKLVGEDGVETVGHVLKTMKLRGVMSQGLVLPVADFGLDEDSSQEEVDEVFTNLGVFKYEAPVPGGGNMVGKFPGEARKTDSERVQNLSDEFLKNLNKSDWYGSEKLDGVSSTFVKRDGKLHVASRNWEVKLEGSIQGRLAKELGLEELMPEGSVIQGEIFGEGVNKNPLKVQGTKLMVFSSNSPIQSEKFDKFVENHSVPVLDLELPDTIDEAVEQVYKMKSTVNPSVYAEGVVWWNSNGEVFDELGDRSNFKAINNHYLIKHGG